MTSPTPPHTGPLAAARQATTRELLAVLFRRKWLILGLFVIATVTVTVISLTTPIRYQSSGQVLVQRGEKQSALTPYRSLFNDWEQDLGSEMALAKSYPVLQRTREILKLRGEQEGRAARKLNPGDVDVEVMGKSNVIGIGYSDLDPEIAQEVCDAVITAYVEYRQSRSNLDRSEKFFVTELADIDRQIEAKMRERERYSRSEGIVDKETQGREMLSERTVLEQRRNDIQTELAEARAAGAAMQKLMEDPNIDLPTLGQAYSNEHALIELHRKVVDQEARIVQMRERFREDAPEVQNARETLESLRALLKREVGARQSIAMSRIETLVARLDVIDQDLAELSAKMDQLPAKTMSLDGIDNEIASLRSRRLDLAKNSDLAQITKNTSKDVSVTLLQPAGFAAALNSRDYVRLALAPAFALIVGIALALFLDGLDLTVRTANQAEEYLELPVLASLTERRKRG